MDLILEIVKDPLLNFWNNYLASLANNVRFLQSLATISSLLLFSIIWFRRYLSEWYYKKYVNPLPDFVLEEQHSRQWGELRHKIENDIIIYTNELEIIYGNSFNQLLKAYPNKIEVLYKIKHTIESSLKHEGEDLKGENYYIVPLDNRAGLIQLFSSLDK